MSDNSAFEKGSEDLEYKVFSIFKNFTRKDIILFSTISFLLLGSASYVIYDEIYSGYEINGSSLELVYNETTCIQSNGINLINIVIKNNLNNSFELENISNLLIDRVNVKSLLSGAINPRQKKLILSYDCSLSAIGFCSGGSHLIEINFQNSTQSTYVECMNVGIGSFCGDGILDEGEQCDDGNNMNNDGCSSSCVIEDTYCGDGILDSGEQCDDGNENDLDGCSNSCELTFCGDNNVQNPNSNGQIEQCDDGNNINNDGCSSSCETEGPSCGDSVCNPSESCSSCPRDCGNCNLNFTVSLGQEEIVFDWDIDRCEQDDIPDAAVNAVRTPQGIVFQSGHQPNTYFSFGTDFNSLERECSTPVHVSGDDWDADSFHNREWISSIYSEDGQTIYGFVHNEYHDPYYPDCRPGETSASNRCWYNSIGLVKSTDGGRTFTHLSPPNHAIAFPPLQWDPRSGSQQNRFVPAPYGYFTPSNVVKKDGYFYMAFRGITSPIASSDTRGVCIARTNNLNNPLGWRYWDGQGYNGQFVNPYTSSGGEWCEFVSWGNLGGFDGESFTYNTYLERYVLVGSGVYDHQGSQTCGFWISTSEDLINWQRPKLLKEGPLNNPPCNNLGYSYMADNHPSIIDHNDASVSFEKPGQNSYLYFIRKHQQGLNRDLIRVPLALEINN